MKHWTDTYRTHAQLIYEVDADIYQNVVLTALEMSTIEKLLDAAKQCFREPILDLACGMGRHSIYMARRKFSVTAVDYSSGFLEIARRNAKGLVELKFEMGDSKALRFPNQSFSTVTLLGNSFGFFNDAQNLQVLREVYRVLRFGGIFVFDASNKRVLSQSFVPYSTSEVQTASFGLVLDERWKHWNAATSTLRCRKRHSSQGKVLLDINYDLRLYGTAEMTTLLEHVGFIDVHTMPLDSSKKFGAMSSRLFFLCQK